MSDFAGPSLSGAFAVSACAFWSRKNESSVNPSPPTKPTCRNDRRVGRTEWEGSSNQVPLITALFISCPPEKPGLGKTLVNATRGDPRVSKRQSRRHRKPTKLEQSLAN